MEENLASFTFLVIIHLREIVVSKIFQILIFLCNIPQDDIVHNNYILLFLFQQ